VKDAVVSPQGLQFTATDPDRGTVAADYPATVTWVIAGAQPTGSWSLSVQSSAAGFSGCGRVPVSAIIVQCSSASGGQGGSGTCSAPFPLSDQPRKIASGGQGRGNSTFNVTVNFTLQDSWKYIASTNSACTINLNYTIQAS
jgi:hypothetical protein